VDDETKKSTKAKDIAVNALVDLAIGIILILIDKAIS